MDVCPSVGKRPDSPSKNSRPVLNLFSPKGNLFDGQCHGKSSLFPQEFAFPGDAIVLRKAEGCNARRLHCPFNSSCGNAPQIGSAKDGYSSFYRGREKFWIKPLDLSHRREDLAHRGGREREPVCEFRSAF